MGFLGTAVFLMTAGWVGYLGYQANFNEVYLLLAPFAFMVSYTIRRSAKSSSIWQGGGLSVLMGLIYQYAMGLVITAIFFGIGWGIMELLKFTPAKGSGVL